jgi:murein DD-endopeptidase MepM/ murein hydrolase activator NlpD
MPSKVRRFPWNVSKAQLLVSAAAAVMLSACSSGADRLSSTASSSDPVYTASVPQRVTAANVGMDDAVTSKPLNNAVGSAPVAPPAYDYGTSYQPQQYRQPAVSAAPPSGVAQPETAATAAALPGSTVTVGPGMTLYAVARANNLSVSQLAAANGIKPPYSVHTGQVLRIPAGGAAKTASADSIPPDNSSFAEPESTPVAPPPGMPIKSNSSVSAQGGSGEMHQVASGETLFSLGRKFGVSPYVIADANGLPHDVQLTVGQTVKIPAGGAGTAPVVAKATAPKSETADANAQTAPKSVSEDVVAMPQPVPEADQAATAGEVGAEAAVETAAKAETKQITEQAPVDGLAGMRWPVRGKIISGFGPKANGLKNEGINIAVPEGTSIRAADGGVIAYAGNELKGYGNLILIRHENGYVTAYAHAKEIFVKRGDTVKRGDVIAKAGQTGSVSSPQLHFEVRKGATALDPMKFLPSATASN